MDGHTTSNSSLVLRLIRGALLWTLPILILTAIVLTLSYRNSTYRLFDEPLDSTITSLVAFTNVGEGGELTVTRAPIDPRYQQALSGQYWIVGAIANSGELVPWQASRSLTDASLWFNADIASKILEEPGVVVETVSEGPDDEPLRVIAKSIYFEDLPNTPIVMAAAADIREANRAIRRFATLSGALLLLLTGGLLVGVFTQVRLGLKPLFDLRDRVVDVREGRASHVDGEYPTEIQPLANELNTLIDHNKTVVEQAKTHVGNLAHALKTPLAVLLNEAKSKDTKLAKVVSRQSESMKNQVDHHLQRARAAARGQVIGVSTPISDIITPLARTLERIYREKDLDFDIELESDLIFRGEKRDLEEMAGNLMDNACKWTQSEVNIRAITDPSDERFLLVTVSDNGPGIDQADYEKAVKRGMRLDEKTPGTGFGLAIVDDLAKAYKGSLSLNRSTVGGLKTVLRLPRTIS